LALGIGVTLGALGGGGSILAVPVLVYVAGQTASAATATSLVAVGAAAAVGVIGHARLGRVRWGAAGAFVATGVAGSWVGSHLNGSIDPQVLLLGFSVLMIVAAHRMVTACPSTNVGEELAVAAYGSGQPQMPATPVAATPRWSWPDGGWLVDRPVRRRRRLHHRAGAHAGARCRFPPPSAPPSW
jgi:hypothetical protein